MAHCRPPIALLLLLLSIAILPRGGLAASLTLDTSDPSQAVLRNDEVAVTLLRPAGRIAGLSYAGRANLLAELPADYDAPSRPEGYSATNAFTFGAAGGAPTNRGYWDGVWRDADGSSSYDGIECESFEVVKEDSNLVIVKFSHVYSPETDDPGSFPLDIDLYYALGKDDTGFYSWAVLGHQSTYPAMSLVELRFTMKLDAAFRWTSLGKDRQRVMPEWSDRYQDNSDPTFITETRLLKNPTNPEFTNEYDTKYNYLLDIGDQLVYGWASNDSEPIGLWCMNPYKYEYTPGGPTKQELTVQTGPYLLNYMHSQHIGTPSVDIDANETWSKTYGPFRIHLNQNTDTSSTRQWKELFEDARAFSTQEYWQWPYEKFADSTYYPSQEERGILKGRLVLSESSGVDPDNIDFKRDGWVGLAPVGHGGSWSYEVKGYQYWSHFANTRSPNFQVSDVRPGDYTLYIYIMGIYGDYASTSAITIRAGETLDIGEVHWSPPRAGPTLFELGYPDRNSEEFYIPDINPLSEYPYSQTNPNKFRDYGVWNAYVKAFPDSDLFYDVSSSDWNLDWWYLQTARYKDDLSSAKPTVYTIHFELEETPSPTSVFTLRVALAGKNEAVLQVFVNTKDYESTPALDTSTYPVPYSSDDNGMARSAAHGAYYKYDVSIPGSALVKGINHLYFRQRRTSDKFIYVAYDYIRLEGPASTS